MSLCNRAEATGGTYSAPRISHTSDGLNQMSGRSAAEPILISSHTLDQCQQTAVVLTAAINLGPWLVASEQVFGVGPVLLAHLFVESAVGEGKVSQAPL